MYGNGVGIGMVVIHHLHRQTQQARHLVLPVCYGAAAGSAVAAAAGLLIAATSFRPAAAAL